MKKKLALGGSALGLAVVTFLAAHRPLKAPAEEAMEPQAAPLAQSSLAEPSASVNASERAETVESKSRMTREQFQNLLETTTQLIPTVAELRKLPAEELHLTPKVLQVAGYQLGLVAEAIENNPALAQEGMSFYENCVLTQNNPTPVRALCLSDYEKLGAKSRLPVREDIAPENIRTLAEQIRNI